MLGVCGDGEFSLLGHLLRPWKWPVKPGEHIHVDFFEKDKQHFLIPYSKRLEVIPMSSPTSLKTTEVLRSLFARYGIPKELVSENAPQLAAAEEFTQFMREIGVKFTPVPPCHPA